jgi:hypothetical protein
VRRIDLVDAQITGSHTDFPLLVTLTEEWLKSTANGGNVRADGFDISFSSDQTGATTLAFQLERLDTTGGNLAAWVKLPALTATTVLYIHYGDPTITESQAQPTAVWSNGYELVAHMNDSGDSTTKNTTTLTAVGAAIGIATAGSFDGASSAVDTGSNAAIDNIFTGGGTVEAWFFADTYGESSRGRIFNKGDTAGWSLFVVNDGIASTSFSFVHADGSSYAQWYGPAASVGTAAWHHLALTYDKASSANDPVAYIDGVAVGVTRFFAPVGTLADDGGSTLFIGNNASNGSRAFDGNLDELRLSSTPRADSWISTQYRNQANPASFYSVSAPL